jgi:hypothetical protein
MSYILDQLGSNEKQTITAAAAPEGCKYQPKLFLELSESKESENWLYNHIGSLKTL